MALDETISAVVEELGYSSVHSLSRLLGLDQESKHFFKSLPFIDTVYYPCSRTETQKDYFSSLAPTLEEDIHLYQFRRSSAGWFAELLSREFCFLVEKYKKRKNKEALTEIRRAWSHLKDYANSIRTPLELEARLLIMVFLMTNKDRLIDKIQEGFLETFSHRGTPKNPEQIREEIEQKFLQNWRSIIKESSLFVGEQLVFTAQWIEKTSEILGKVARDYWRKGLLNEDEYLEQVGNCLEFKTIPSVAALMPTEPPKRNFKGTVWDPRTRLELAAKALSGIPEAAIRRGDMSKVMERIESVMPVMDKHDILEKRKLAAECVHAGYPKQPLITLRLSKNSMDDEMRQRWISINSLCTGVNDDTAPSIVIFLEHNEPVVELHNSDMLGKKFLRELGILCDGYELLTDSY